MVTTNDDPKAGGNTDQPDDGRDSDGRLPEPLDSAHVGNPDGPGLDLPGMPASQPAGTGPVVSTPYQDPKDKAAQDARGGNTDQPDPAKDDTPPPAKNDTPSAPSTVKATPGNAKKG